MFDFTKKKFLLLAFASQHKKCAELIKLIYQKHHCRENISKEIELYNQLLSWMNEPFQLELDYKILSDRYHWHLQFTKMSVKEHRFLTTVMTQDRSEGEDYWPLAVYLDHLRSSHNVGSILRTVEAFRFGTVYFSPQTPDVTQTQVQNTSMGTFKWINAIKTNCIETLPKPLMALETCVESISIYDFTFPDNGTIVVGNEEYGCSDQVLNQADHLLKIPLRGKKNSLNVANAFAIVAAEIYRQRAQSYEKIPKKI